MAGWSMSAGCHETGSPSGDREGGSMSQEPENQPTGRIVAITLSILRSLSASTVHLDNGLPEDSRPAVGAW